MIGDTIYRMKAVPKSTIETIDKEINNYYNQISWQEVQDFNTAVYEYRDHKTGNTVGFVTASMSKLFEDLEDRKTNYPAILLGRLGVDKAYKGLKYGEELVKFVIGLGWELKDKIGCRLIILDVDMNNNTLIEYYKRLGFEQAVTQNKKQLLSMYFDLKHLKI